MIYTASQLLEDVNQHIASLRFDRQPQGLYDPVAYVLSIGGKRIRPVLMLMAYNLYKEEVEAIYPQAIGLEIYHNYTLLHDDLMDRADKRRGRATVHQVWNDNTAILSGDAMLVLAYQYMAHCPSEHLKEVMDLFSLTALEICEGQQMDMDFESRMDVKEEEYIEMIRLKTSVLLATALKIGAMMAGASAEDAAQLYDFGMHMGVAFQLKDDWLDVYGNPEVFGKNIGGDILCNKKTYMLIEALRRADPEQHKRLTAWIEATDFIPSEKVKEVTAIYDEIGIGNLCQEKVAAYTARGLEALDKVSLPDARKAVLRQLMVELIHRES